MNTLSSFVKQNRLVSFVVLAYALSWWVPLLNVEDLPPVAAFGPFLTALIVLGLTEGRSGVKTLLGRMVRWRVGLQWYLIALGLPILLGGLASYLAVLLVMIIHAMNNAASGEFFSPMFTGVYSAQQAWMRVLVWGLVALVVLIGDWRWWTETSRDVPEEPKPALKTG